MLLLEEVFVFIIIIIRKGESKFIAKPSKKSKGIVD
jgi:hypothetical protein